MVCADMDFAQMAKLCAPAVAPATLQRLASVESSGNPYAIGVVGGRLERQPVNAAEALATARALEVAGWDYSAGLIQVNQKNFAKYDLTPQNAFDPCTNLRVGADILADCYKRAGGAATKIGDALSCYYAGNFRAGYRLGYVAKVMGMNTPRPEFERTQAIPVISVRQAHQTRVAKRPKAQTSPVGPFVSAPKAPTFSLAPVNLSATPANLTALLF